MAVVAAEGEAGEWQVTARGPGGDRDHRMKFQLADDLRLTRVSQYLRELALLALHCGLGI